MSYLSLNLIKSMNYLRTGTAKGGRAGKDIAEGCQYKILCASVRLSSLLHQHLHQSHR